MNHLIEPIDLINSGLPISDDITEAEMEFAIDTIEQYVVKDFLTPDTLEGILGGETEYESLIPTIKTSMYHLVFAYMLYDRIRLTRYTAVIKDDEYSKDPTEKDLREVCSLHAEVGIKLLKDVAEGIGKVVQNYRTGKLNGFIFSELIF